MDDNFDLLKDLPRFDASPRFNEILVADAEQIIRPTQASHLSKTAPLWLSFAMAASLSVGVWLGFAQQGALENALTGLGLGSLATTSTDLDSGDIYDENLTEMGI